MKADFTPYEGDKPYIFVSYSHRDSAQVIPLLNALHAAGYRVWYDEGIPWGLEWMNTIAEKIQGAGLCLVFHSHASAQSFHCSTEIAEMIEDRKTTVSVYLEESVQLEPGVRMYLRRFQDVRYYQFNNQSEFLEQVNGQRAFDPCQGIAKHSLYPNWQRRAILFGDIVGFVIMILTISLFTYYVVFPERVDSAMYSLPDALLGTICLFLTIGFIYIFRFISVVQSFKSKIISKIKNRVMKW